MPQDNPSVGRYYFSTVRKTLNLQRIFLSRVVGYIPAFILLLSVVLSGVFSGFSTPQTAYAQTPNTTLNFQARILNLSGSLVPDGDYNLEFKIYDTVNTGGTAQGACSGNCLWMETRSGGNVVRVVNGYVSVNLGSVTSFPSNMPWGNNLYITMRVGGTGAPSWDTQEMTNSGNRMKMSVAPVAFVANNVASGSTNSASTNSSTISIQSGSALGTASNSGNITIDSGAATGTTGTVVLGATNASALTIGRTGITTTLQGSVALTGAGTALTVTNNVQVDGDTTLGSSSADTLTVNANASFTGNLTVTAGDTFTNAGSTLFTAITIANDINGGVLGDNAASTVNIATTLNVAQTTASQTFTLASPTTTTAGRIMYVNNTGSTSFTLEGNPIAVGKSASYIWNGSAWVQTISFTSTGVDTVGAIDTQTKSANGAVISGTSIYFQTADASNVGLVSTGVQTFAGAKTFNGSVTLAASQSLTITGGNTASRPGSPTEGMVYFDTTTKQLLTYANGKWQGDRNTSTKIVAANNSSQALKDSADYIADGTADEVEINAALTAAAGGKVYLAEGTYVAAATISIPNNTTLAGAGTGTEIQLADLDATENLIENTNTTTGTGVVIRDIAINGRNDLNTAGTQYGIRLNGMGAGSGASARNGGQITNVLAKNFRTIGLQIISSNNNTISNNVVRDSSTGIQLDSSLYNTIIGNTTQGNSSSGIYISNASNTNTVTGNTDQGSTNYGIRISASTNNTVTGNTVVAATGYAVYLDSSANYNAVSSNNIKGSGDGIYVNSSSNNVISSNNLEGNGYGIHLLASSNNNTITGNTVSGGTYGIYINSTASSYSTITGNTVQNVTGGVYLVNATYSTVSANTIRAASTWGIILSSATGNNVSSNQIYDTGGATTSNAVYLTDSDNNSVSGNLITDTACTTNCYAINIFDSSSDNNYLGSNTYRSTSADQARINDAGTNTRYASQLTPATVLQSGSSLIRANASSTLTGTADPDGDTTPSGTGTKFTTELQVGDRITINAETRTVTVITNDTTITVDTAFSNTASASVTRLTAILRVADSSGVNQLLVQDNGNISASGQLLVNGTGANQSQLIVRANSGQTVANPLILLQDSSAVELARINATTTSLYFGNAAGGNSAAGVNNTGIGASALGSVLTGTGNTTLGSGALASVSVNNNNTAVGYNAGNLATGGNNIFLGALAGDNVTTGTDNIIIGYNLDASAAGVTNELRIGGVLQGNTSTLAAQFNGTLAVTTLGSADTSTFLCRNTSNQLATCSSTPLTNSLTDNITDAFDLQEGTNNYININTTNTTENIAFGNATTNPSYSFLGSGTLAVTGSQTVGGNLDVSGTIFAGTADAFQVATTGAVTAVGVNAGAGLLQGQLGLTVTGNTSLSTTAGNTTTVGNATGLLALTGSAGNLFIFNGVTIDDTELNRLDGKDAALVDTNDAVNTAITGTGALNTGSITSGFGAIDIGADTITSGLINGQTISATANFTGTLTVQGASATLGVASTTTGSAIFRNAGGAGGITLTSANPGASNFTLTLPAETGTICTTGSICSGYQAAGSFATTSLNNIAATNLSAALNVTSGNLNLTTTTSGNIVLNSAGTIELQDNTNVTGNLDISGSITGGSGNEFSATNAGISYFGNSNSALYVGRQAGLPFFGVDASTNGTDNGIVFLTSTPADAGTTTKSSTELVVQGSYFNGSTNYNDFTLQTVISGTTASDYRLAIKNTANTELLSITGAGAAALTGNLDTSGTIFAGTGDAFQVSSGGAVTAVGVNAGAGQLQGSLGLTVTGATTNINVSSNFDTNINTGTSTGAVNIGSGSGANAVAIGNSASTTTVLGTTNINTTGSANTSIGNGTGTFALNSSNFDVSTAGALSGITGYTQTSGNFAMSGAGTFGTGTGTISLNGATSITGTNTLTVGTGLTSLGGALTVTGLTTLNGGLTVETGDIFTFNGDAFDDLTGSGLSISSGDLIVDATSATGFFRNGGNAFAGTATLGTTDANALAVVTGGTGRAVFTNGNTLYLGNSNTSGTAAAPSAFTVYGTSSSTAATAGGALTVSSGIGNTSGAGGLMTLQSGQGGSTGAGGAISLVTGAGGSTSGASGALNILTGNVTSGTAGSISIDVGTSTASNGSILIGTAARSQTITLGNTTGGAFSARGSALTLRTNDVAVSSGIAGTISLLSGAGTVGSLDDFGGAIAITSGNGGYGGRAITLTAGSATTANSLTGSVFSLGAGNTLLSTAGNVSLTGGTAGSTRTETGGSITLTGGVSNNTSSAGGAVTITGGNTTGAGPAGGALVIDGGTSATGTPGAVSVGATNSRSITVGNTTGATALTLRVGTGNFSLDGVASSNYSIGASTTTGIITLGAANQTGDITLGRSNSTNSILIGNGAGATTVSIANAAVTGATVNIAGAANTSANTVSIANGTSAANSTVSILSGAGTAGVGTLNLGNNTRVTSIDIGNIAAVAARTINLGTGSNTVGIDTINIGTGATTVAGGKTINIGSGTPTGSGSNLITIGSTALASTTTINAGTGLLNFGATQAQFTEVTGTRALTVQTRTTNIAGSALTVQAGSAGAGASAFTGGALTLQGGSAGGTGNANGGNVSLVGGTGTGTGVKGLVLIDTATFSAATVQNFTGNANITQANIDSLGSILISGDIAGRIATITDPTTTTAGRVVYVTNTGSVDITLAANTVGVALSLSLKPATTATMYWNGVDWTAAGASSSTDLQAAYNNTASSAGAAELVLKNTSTSNGLTVRNGTSTDEITGGLFEVQTSIGSNLFTVNNNAVEYATNGGAETAGGTAATFPATTWDTTTGGTIDRYNSTTGGYDANNVGTGQASVRMVTTTTNHGARNRISTSLTSGLTYTVSYAVRGATNFATLQTLYSPDGTTAGTTTCATAQTVTSGQWTRISCTFVASGTITSSNSILIRQTDATSRTFYIDNLSVNVNASANFAGDGTADNAGTFATNWGDYEAGAVVTVAQETSVIYEGSASARAIITPATANVGIRNNMAITPAINTQFLVSFYARSTTTVTSALAVGFLPAGGTGLPSGTAGCVDYNTQSLVANTWTKITCLFTTPGSGISNPDLVIYQTDTAARTIYVDALSITLNTNNSNNIQIGGGNKGGPATLFTLDRSASAPIADNNDAYLGSMYYNTTTGRIQCYEADGWGACGAAPDNIVNLNPEYAGAVLNGTGVGTMTADFCAEQAGVLNVNTALCASGEAKNFYKWTSPQATQQTYSIYVTYQLPATFNGFSSDDTVQLVALTDSANATVSYEMYKSTGSAVTACGTETTVSTGVQTLWQTVGINGNESTGCSFNSASASNFVIFKINMKANSNANAYVSTLSFTTTGR